MFVQAYLFRQIGDIDFLFIIVFDIGQDCLNVFHALVVILLCRSEEMMFGKHCKYGEQRGLDI